MNFQIDEKLINLNGRSFYLRLPHQSENNVNQLWEKYEQDEKYFPYWLSAWNAAYAFFLYSQNIKFTKYCIELACGNGILSQLMSVEVDSERWHRVDISWEALQFAQQAFPQILNDSWICVDLNQPCFKQSFELIVACEFSYEDQLVKLFIDFCVSHLAPNGTAYLVETVKAGRDHNQIFIKSLWHSDLEVIDFNFMKDGQCIQSKIFKLTKS